VIDPFATVAFTSSVRANAGLGYNAYSGINTTRQDRFQAREQRRWGDWTYWGIPAPVLWLEDPFVLSPFDDILFITPAYVDIWAD
jgi:hypothetical protein